MGSFLFSTALTAGVLLAIPYLLEEVGIHTTLTAGERLLTALVVTTWWWLLTALERIQNLQRNGPELVRLFESALSRAAEREHPGAADGFRHGHAQGVTAVMVEWDHLRRVHGIALPENPPTRGPAR